MTQSFHPATYTSQALGSIEPATQGLTAAIYPSATYQRTVVADGYAPGKVYARDENPTFQTVEALLTKLEHGHAASVFASGMAACSAVILALPPGSHVVIPQTAYIGLINWCKELGAHWGYTFSYYPNDDMPALEKAIKAQPTAMVWVETPGNPLWNVTDIRKAAGFAKAAGAVLVVDNTVPTPVLTNPLLLGADLVVHSCSKYLNGHHDVIAGAIVTREDSAIWQRIQRIRKANGGILGAFESWLLLRGMQTLHVRVAKACENAQAFAEHFSRHPAIEAVLYPGLASDPGHAVAGRQMQGGFGGMLSLLVKGGAAAALNVCRHVEVFKCATSLGGTESLIEHRATVEDNNPLVPKNLLRLSIGTEHIDDLIADVERALACPVP